MELLSVEELGAMNHTDIDVDMEIEQMMFGLAVKTVPTSLQDYKNIVYLNVTTMWDSGVIQVSDLDDLIAWELEEITEAYRTNKCPMELALKISKSRN
jgi:hypothetical protein